MVHNKIFIFGKSNITYHNIPMYYDIMVIPFPPAIDYKDITDRMDFTGVLMDMGTGTFEPIFLRKLPIFQKIFNVFLPTRSEINKMLDLQFLVEGRYLSFWFTSMEEDFRPVGYAPFHVPDEFEIFKYEAGMQYFYSLNWGQKSIEDVYKQRIVAIVYDGFSKIHFNRISSMEIQLDYRVLKVNLDYPMPEIIISDIDVITTFLYVRSNKEDITFNFVTSDIAYVTLDLIEDYRNYYNPFVFIPIIYPGGIAMAREYMTKDEYDKNRNGKVDYAEQADYALDAGGLKGYPINIDNVSNGQVLVYSNGIWRNENISVENGDGGLGGYPVNVGNPSNGQVLVYRNGIWRNENIPTENGGGGGENDNGGLGGYPVNVGNPSNGQVLVYRNGTWRNETIPDGGGNENISVESAVVRPEDFGAFGDGSHDDTVAVKNMFDAIVNDQTSKKYTVFLPRIYRVTEPIEVPLNHALALRGGGIDVGGFLFDGNLDSTGFGLKLILGDANHLTINDLSILATSTGQYTAIGVEEAEDVAAHNRTKNRYVFSKVRIAGASSVVNSGWGKGISLTNVQNGHIFGLTFEGYAPNGQISSGCAIHCEGSNVALPTVIQIGHSNIYYAQKAIYVHGHVEGLFLHESNLVAVDFGLHVENGYETELPYMPQFNVVNNHIAFKICAVNLRSVSQSCITSNLFYSREDSQYDTLTAVQLDASVINRVHDNVFVKIIPTPSFNGIVITSGSDFNYVGPNTFQTSGGTYTAVWLQAGSGDHNVLAPQNQSVYVGDGITPVLDERHKSYSKQ